MFTRLGDMWKHARTSIGTNRIVQKGIENKRLRVSNSKTYYLSPSTYNEINYGQCLIEEG